MAVYFSINLVIIATILIGALIAWKLAKRLDDSFKSNHGGNVAIKIDVKGNYHYNSIPESGGTNLLFWLRFMIVVITLLLLVFPVGSLLNRS